MIGDISMSTKAYMGTKNWVFLHENRLCHVSYLRGTD